MRHIPENWDFLPKPQHNPKRWVLIKKMNHKPTSHSSVRAMSKAITRPPNDYSLTAEKKFSLRSRSFKLMEINARTKTKSRDRLIKRSNPGPKNFFLINYLLCRYRVWKGRRFIIFHEPMAAFSRVFLRAGSNKAVSAIEWGLWGAFGTWLMLWRWTAPRFKVNSLAKHSHRARGWCFMSCEVSSRTAQSACEIYCGFWCQP